MTDRNMRTGALYAGVSRRTFLAAGSCWLTSTALSGSSQETPPRTRLVLLGTAGGPTPKATSAAPAQAIVVGDRIYLVDCGDGVARQLAFDDQLAGIGPVAEHRRARGQAIRIRRGAQVVLHRLDEGGRAPVAEGRGMHLRRGGQPLLAVAQHIGQPPEVELQALVLVTEVFRQSGLALLLVGLGPLTLDAKAFEVRSALGLAEYVSLNVAALTLSLISGLLALASQHALKE